MDNGAPDISHLVYPPREAYRTLRLEVSPRHELYVEESGNPDGRPAVFLHGGPGSQAEAHYRQLFDPASYRLVMFDQRGAGRSAPSGSIEDNTTWHLVDDIEALRTHLGIDQWQVVGGSWGSTLGLCYAQTYPNSVSAMVLWSIWLANRVTQRWRFEHGANMVYPDAWEAFVANFSESERADLEAATYRRIRGGDEQVAAQTAKALAIWELASVHFHPRERNAGAMRGEAFVDTYGRIISHYFENGCFLDGEHHIVEHCAALDTIPATLVHGRFDMCTPLWEAWQLKKAWTRADLWIIEHGGHMVDEPEMAQAVVAALDRYAA